MKTLLNKELLIKIAGAVTLIFLCLNLNIVYAAQCDIERIIGAKVQPGTYKVTVTRETDNLYKVMGQEIYIKTRYCYEYVYSQNALLEIIKVHEPSNIVMGTIYFLR